MKNIEEMRAKMEKEIRFAEISNEIEKKVGIECRFVSESLTQKGKSRVHFGEVSKEQAAKVLKAMPVTEKATTYCGQQGYKEMSYILELHRYPKEWATKMYIEWISGEWAVDLEIPVTSDDPVLGQYVKMDHYEIDDSTIGLYYGCVSPRDKANLKTVHCLNFNCGRVIRFNDGYFKQTSEGHAECIVSEIIGE